MIISTAAGSHVHQYWVIFSGSLALAIKVPSDGVPIGRPKPKNESPVSTPMFSANDSVVSTIINDEMFGMISLKIILKLLVPDVFDAAT